MDSIAGNNNDLAENEKREELIQMMKQYPLLSSWKANTKWTGFIDVNNDLLKITINAPNFPLVKGADIRGDERTQDAFRPYNSQIQSLLDKESMDLVNFLGEVMKLLKSSEDSSCASSALTKMERTDDQFYTALMKELEKIGFGNILHLSKDYREVHLKVIYENREHVVKYQLQSKYPNVPLNVILDVPMSMGNAAWPNRIREANVQISNQLSHFNPFWDEMDNLDLNVRVIDPVKPNRSHTYRRVAISNRVNMHVEVNPLKPTSFPEINFTGPVKIVQELEAKLGENCKKWNEQQSLLKNLESLLEFHFLEKEGGAMDVDESSMNCIVCLNYELEGNVPERRCECGSQYHNKCLYELFMSEFSVALKRSVDCPTCGMELRISVVPD